MLQLASHKILPLPPKPAFGHPKYLLEELLGLVSH